jgi:hypothetical protein
MREPCPGGRKREVLLSERLFDVPAGTDIVMFADVRMSAGVETVLLGIVTCDMQLLHASRVCVKR